MTRKNKTVVISLPIELINKIENNKGDYTRSIVYKKLILQGLKTEQVKK